MHWVWATRRFGKPSCVVSVKRVTVLLSPMWMALDRVTSPNPTKWLPSPSLRSQGTDVVSHGCDVRSAESVKQLFDVVMEHFGRVDVLINNAGIGFVMKDTREVSPDEWNLMMSH